jgi:hypothetical protein
VRVGTAVGILIFIVQDQNLGLSSIKKLSLSSPIDITRENSLAQADSIMMTKIINDKTFVGGNKGRNCQMFNFQIQKLIARVGEDQSKAFFGL